MQSPALTDKQSSTVSNLLQVEPAVLSLDQLLPETEFPLQDSNNFNTESTGKETLSSKTKRRKTNGGTPRGRNYLSFVFYVYCIFNI